MTVDNCDPDVWCDGGQISCDDDACTVDACDPDSGCSIDCDDYNACTDDSCGCLYTVVD